MLISASMIEDLQAGFLCSTRAKYALAISYKALIIESHEIRFCEHQQRVNLEKL